MFVNSFGLADSPSLPRPGQARHARPPDDLGTRHYSTYCSTSRGMISFRISSYSSTEHTTVSLRTALYGLASLMKTSSQKVFGRTTSFTVTFWCVRATIDGLDIERYQTRQSHPPGQQALSRADGEEPEDGLKGI
jgi:hypothetical protein